MSNSLRPHGLQHNRSPCASPTPGVYSNSCPLSWWCHPTISSSVVHFSSCPQSFPASGSFQMSQFFASGDQSIGVRFMNLGKLEVVKQQMARVNINILGISELKWTGMGEFNSDNHYIYYWGQDSLRRNGLTIIVNKRVWNVVLGCNLKNDRMISIHTRQTIQYHSNRSMPLPVMLKKLKVNGSTKTYKTF